MTLAADDLVIQQEYCLIINNKYLNLMKQNFAFIYKVSSLLKLN